MTELKLTPKQERFCQAYIETGNATEAYRRAYDAGAMKEATINVKACELLKSGKIAGRVRELASHHMKRHEVTVDSLVAELEEARALAKNIEQPSAMVAAVMGKAKITGNIIERSEITGKDGGAIMVEDISKLDLARRIASLLTSGTKE